MEYRHGKAPWNVRHQRGRPLALRWKDSRKPGSFAAYSNNSYLDSAIFDQDVSTELSTVKHSEIQTRSEYAVDQRNASAVHSNNVIELRPFSCVECGKRFKHRHHLQYHERQHSGDKPFVCDICFKTFTQLSNMYTHRKRHSKDVKCEACGRTFTNWDKLRFHLCDLTVKDE